MRIKVDYTTVYDYTLPASGVVQLLRVEPHGHEDQSVLDWRVDVDADGSLRRSTDVFGNIVHAFYAEHPILRLALKVRGDVDTLDTGGVIRGSSEPLAPPIYLRSTPLSTADGAIRDFARGHVLDTPLKTLHAIMLALNERTAFDADATGTGTDAATAFASGRGVCQDYTHIFCAAARHLGYPARYVSGHFVNAETQPAGHAWAEAYVEDLGWVGFDATHAISTSERHVRVAVGLDYLDAAPVRGARRGGAEETMRVEVNVTDAGTAGQSQSQRQSQSQGSGQSQSQGQNQGSFDPGLQD